MNFYDDDEFYERKRRKRRSGAGIFTSLFSAIVGGFIVILLLPTLIDAGLIEISTQQSTTLPIQDGTKVPTKQITVDVNSSIVTAVEKVKPAVVGVVNIQEQSSLWTRKTRIVEAGEGSGVVFDKKNGKAYIVTNNHVIEGAKEIEVALPNTDSKISAELLGADRLTDLAVIAIDEKYVDTVAEFGDSTNLKPGEPAIAIGNPLGRAFSQSVTVGVISSTNRSIPNDLDKDGQADWETEVIQTDAAINPGNSGGALVNIDGQVIGINSAKIAESGVEGLGFAIPISDAKPIIEQLIKYGRVKRPYMGVTPYDLHLVSQKDRKNVLNLPDSVNNGVVLVELSKLGPSALAGLNRLDVIVKLDDYEIESSSDLRKYLYKYKNVGDKMKVTFYRKGRLQTITMTLSEVPETFR
ncbi:serine protease [Vulcanibacillus modesticaldus]|uniref:Serine protease n=1 Tax=Vulcanibacillus modesticaldus TaxID=337097 RepID=A0A1D2YVH5_9BACI|nr:trypsin-like peptidase domain-containing protein [Vulcanibacillus modesticaldus]OEF99657.1 serine protease [Vulcanibacillus modesticaldus]